MITASLIRTAFIRATQSMSGAHERWQNSAATGLTDAQLADRLRFELGSLGGYHGPGLDLEYCADGLRIWASANGFVRRTTDQPILHGAHTIAFAREVYGIKDPTKPQLELF